ncbi:MAG: LysR family transcriptional regulator [Phycisphaerae bacterium]|nr:LysR family transcriptional regulator [Phycisphaerae bacterium]
MDQIKIFCDLAETRSFSKSAARNLISQSAVSQQIKNIELQFKLQLIDRTCRPLALTQAGEIFYQGCKNIYNQYEEMRNQLASFSHQITGSVTIAGIPSIVLYLLQPYIRFYLQHHPNVRLYVEPMRANQAIETVLTDHADIGMVASPKADRRLDIMPFYREKLLLVMHPKHPLASRKKVPIKSIELQPFIHFEKDQPTRKLIDKIFRQYDITVKSIMELDNIETMKRGIEANVGLSILPEPAIKQELQAGTLIARPLAEEDFSRTVGIVFRKGKVFSEPVTRFVNLLKKPLETIVAQLET